MTIDEAIELLLIERECVNRNNEHHILCDRNCEKCDLVQDADKIIDMYGNVAKWLEELKILRQENGCDKCEGIQWDALYHSEIKGYNKALDDFIKKAEKERDNIYNWDEDEYENGMKAGYQYSIEIAEQLRE